MQTLPIFIHLLKNLLHWMSKSEVYLFCKGSNRFHLKFYCSDYIFTTHATICFAKFGMKNIHKFIVLSSTYLSWTASENHSHRKTFYLKTTYQKPFLLIRIYTTSVICAILTIRPLYYYYN